MSFLRLIAVLGMLISSALWADPKFVRWTGADDSNADVQHILSVLNTRTGLNLSISDFLVVEDRPLAYEHFTMLNEMASGIPIHSEAIRIWTSLTDGTAVQVEANVDAPPANAAKWAGASLSSEATMAIIRSAAKQISEDPYVVTANWKDYWDNGKVVRFVKAKGRHGVHSLRIDVVSGAVLSNTYRQFPQADNQPTQGEFSIPVQIYPIYEQVEGVGTVLPRISSELRYLHTETARPTADPFVPLRSRQYIDDKEDPLLGLTVDGQKQGYWAMSLVKQQALSIQSSLPLTPNDFAHGVVLDGRYATVSIYPNSLSMFKQLSFTPQFSSVFIPLFVQMANNPDHQEMVPQAGLRGRPITSLDDAWNRIARIDPQNDPETYFNDGFDELQVYWSVTQLFDSLHEMGWTDPELSTRRFNAFLYNPDISYRDNAFYTDDTINFNTYSSGAVNDARDNSTIWHELGHGVMDRLMGDDIQLADTGGLSEGMADFVAQLVLNSVTGGVPYPGKERLRIFNHTGFYLTDEEHDDGEAYGGTMNDLLVEAMAHYGREGLIKVGDLTLETMRLTRNHPALTAPDWFNHMLFADQLGDDKREPGELHDLILKALGGRNFTLDNSPHAQFHLKNGDNEIVSGGVGTRYNPVKLKMAPTDTQSFTLHASLQSSPTYQFQYPVTVKVEFEKGALQGAIHWDQKAQNPLVYTLAQESDSVTIPLSVKGKCDEVNRPDGSCVDYAYVEIFNHGEENGQPRAKKRFYLQIEPK